MCYICRHFTEYGLFKSFEFIIFQTGGHLIFYTLNIEIFGTGPQTQTNGDENLIINSLRPNIFIFAPIFLKIHSK